MKKLFFTSLIIGCLFASTRQVNAQELGVRFGNTVYNDVAVDAVFSSGQFSRIHADASFGTGLGLEVLWDFMYRPLSGEAFHWYVGAGPTMLIHDPFFFGVSGEIGLEYHFNGAPIALGIDWRPTFYIVQDTDFETDGFGFNVRYVFGKK